MKSPISRKRKIAPIEDIRSFESPESSNIARAVYNADAWTLKVTFKTGATYQYAEVPPDLWVDFEHADSKGKAFAELIRPWFKGTKL